MVTVHGFMGSWVQRFRVHGFRVQRFRVCMIMPDAPALPFVVSSSTCWPTSKANERKVTLNGEL